MLIDYFFGAFKKYADFKGRARRSEYWYFQLFNILTIIVLAMLGFPIFKDAGSFIILLYVLISIIPTLALIVRRLHDVGKSGWFYFISIVPIIGSIWLFVLLVTDSDFGQNEYGPNPKGIGNEYDEEDEVQISQIGQ